MPITADKVRELVARGNERPELDFKGTDYDWSVGNRANAELAKDLMAKANLLGPDDAPAYILIGVKNDGEIVGIAKHLDDADLQAKVSAWFIRPPKFLYGAVDVDGFSVGVYEIRPGGRPFYPIREIQDDKNRYLLQKNIALVSTGTKTSVPTPHEIIEWSRMDDRERHELQSLDLAEARARSTPHGTMITSMTSGDIGLSITGKITNTGRAGFFVERVDWRIVWTERFYADARGLPDDPMPDGYTAPSGSLELQYRDLVGQGQSIPFEFKYRREQALEHFKDHALEIQGFAGQWAGFDFTAHCRSDAGGLGVIRHRVSQAKIVEPR